MRRYRTIVADPPWPQPTGGPRTQNTECRDHRRWRQDARPSARPYTPMRLGEIEALPVAAIAASDSHLYLWTTNAFLEDALAIVRIWGFRRSATLVWAKTPMGLGPGGAYANTAEFVIFARRGSLAPLRRWPSTWFHAKRPTVRHERNVSPRHSAKPPEFVEMVEQVSPGPYVELFSRATEPRPGWDYWGDESLGTAEIPAVVA